MNKTSSLKRAMSTRQLIVFGLVFMVPISPFGIFGIVHEYAGSFTPLAYLIGMIGILFTAYSYWSMLEVFPLAGSVYAYTSRGINPNFGFISGWALILDYLLIPALVCIISVKALQSILPGVSGIVWVILFIGINTIINIMGIELTAKINKILLAFELIIFIIFIVCGVRIIVENPQSMKSFTLNYGNGSLDGRNLMRAASIAVLSFMGFDGISTLAEEAKGGTSSVGKAGVWSIVIIGILFIIQTTVASIICAGDSVNAEENQLFYFIANEAGGPLLMKLCAIATGIAWGVADAMVAQVVISRVLYSMSRDGFLPRTLSKIHVKYHTPYIATVFVSVVSIILVGVFFNKINILTSVVNFGALTTFVVLNVTVIIYFIKKKGSKRYFKYLVMPLIGALVVGVVWMYLGLEAKIIGFCWLGIGVVYLIVTRKYLKREIKLSI